MLLMSVTFRDQKTNPPPPVRSLTFLVGYQFREQVDNMVVDSTPCINYVPWWLSLDLTMTFVTAAFKIVSIFVIFCSLVGLPIHIKRIPGIPGI